MGSTGFWTLWQHLLRGEKGTGSWAIGRGLPKIPLLIDNTRQFQKFNEKLTTRKSNWRLIETQWTRQFVSLSFGIELRANKYQIEIEQTVGCSGRLGFWVDGLSRERPQDWRDKLFGFGAGI